MSKCCNAFSLLCFSCCLLALSFVNKQGLFIFFRCEENQNIYYLLGKIWLSFLFRESITCSSLLQSFLISLFFFPSLALGSIERNIITARRAVLTQRSGSACLLILLRERKGFAVTAL
ncbi:hypothetical protein BX070DRAFT_223310 [Coemansia spiralis]|nr:hypothetical protein BX070DRAFT_223310 [Coemansia spiralis]